MHFQKRNFKKKYKPAWIIARKLFMYHTSVMQQDTQNLVINFIHNIQ